MKISLTLTSFETFERSNSEFTAFQDFSHKLYRYLSKQMGKDQLDNLELHESIRMKLLDISMMEETEDR